MSITTAFFVLLLVIFAVDPGDSGGEEGEYILPGDAAIESFYPIMIVPILIICGFIALFLSTRIFLRIYVNTLGKNRRIGLVQTKELTNSEMAKKILLRSIILIFFTLNICYTLVSQEVIVQFFRSPEPDAANYIIPDPALMYAIAWIIAIPCTFILIPVWAMNDLGLVASKKNKELDFEHVDLASGTLYKIIKGYAGVGFLYNLIVMIIAWSMQTSELQYFFLQNVSPIMFISFGFPLVIYLETQREKLREKMWDTLQKTQMANSFSLDINLEPLNDLKEFK
ncbi:MAG: hypothetical protein EU544_02640 [Promethearchaeota archaeon]|nr:MAG: hypothetical protein EU544_02640 [Candidatus Lokiarchaeota archaeon]